MLLQKLFVLVIFFSDLEYKTMGFIKAYISYITSLYFSHVYLLTILPCPLSLVPGVTGPLSPFCKVWDPSRDTWANLSLGSEEPGLCCTKDFLQASLSAPAGLPFL